MAKRQADVIELRGGPGSLGVFSSVEIMTSLTSGTEAKFLVGDDRSWKFIEPHTRPGAEYEVWLNSRALFKGRVSTRESPVSVGGGGAVELGLQTKFADAKYASADPSVRQVTGSLKDFLIALFAQHGYTEADFQFAPRAAVNLLTGSSKPGQKNVDLAPITLLQAMVQPPETVEECAKRHLQRHGLMMWESPDGKICIGQPEDKAEALGRLRCRRDAAGSAQNNICDMRRIEDWKDVASEVRVLGQTAENDAFKRSIKASSVDPGIKAVADLPSHHFFRPIRMPIEAGKTIRMAEIQALRELSVRRRRVDAWDILVDGWSYWDGQRSIPWSINDICNVDADPVGGAMGDYLIWRVLYRLTKDGQSTQLALVRKGLWDIGDVG